MDINEANEMEAANIATGPDREFPITLTQYLSTDGEANPNRPTSDNYCAQCAHTLDYHPEGCFFSPQPHTAQQTLNRSLNAERRLTLDTLDTTQLRNVLMTLMIRGHHNGYESDITEAIREEKSARE